MFFRVHVYANTRVCTFLYKQCVTAGVDTLLRIIDIRNMRLYIDIYTAA